MPDIRVERDKSGPRTRYNVISDGLMVGRYSSKQAAEEKASILEAIADQSARIQGLK